MMLANSCAICPQCTALMDWAGLAAVEALRDRRRRLRRSAIALHLDRPCFCLGTVGLADGLPCGFPCPISVDLRAADPTTENDFA
jgi:hypothetical protein